MSVNIIIKSNKPKVSNEEMAERINEANAQAVIREKHEYKERSRKIRKAAEELDLPKDVRVRAVYDSRMFMRHEQANPGCMSDESYLRELRRDNEEIRLD
jgi:acyl-coenzyme A synthetase/AMP-(fatty) acid ligase